MFVFFRAVFVLQMTMKDLTIEICNQLKRGLDNWSLSIIEFLEYESTIEDKVNTILKRDFCIPEEIRNNIIEMIKYNAVGGKMIRGLFAVYSSFVLCDNWDMQMKEE